MATKITWNGQVYTVPEIARMIGITPGAMRYRLRTWPRYLALTLPADARHKPSKADEKTGSGNWMHKLEG